MKSARRVPIATMTLLASHVYDRWKNGGSPGRRRQHFKVFLWATIDDLREAAPACDRGSAIHCPTPSREVYKDGEWMVRPRNLLARIHFAAGQWTEETVAHELVHALFEADRSGVGEKRLGDLEDASFSHEEEWCYRYGRWFSTVYRWLWENDPGPRYRAIRDDVSAVLRERLAADEHDRWSRWMAYLFEKCEQKDGSVFIPRGYADALRRQIITAYDEGVFQLPQAIRADCLILQRTALQALRCPSNGRDNLPLPRCPHGIAFPLAETTMNRFPRRTCPLRRRHLRLLAIATDCGCSHCE